MASEDGKSSIIAVSFHSSMLETEGARSASKIAKVAAYEDHSSGSPRVGRRTRRHAVFEGEKRSGGGYSAGFAASGSAFASGGAGAGSGTGRARADACGETEEARARSD